MDRTDDMPPAQRAAFEEYMRQAHMDARIDHAWERTVRAQIRASEFLNSQDGAAHRPMAFLLGMRLAPHDPLCDDYAAVREHYHGLLRGIVAPQDWAAAACYANTAGA